MVGSRVPTGRKEEGEIKPLARKRARCFGIVWNSRTRSVLLVLQWVVGVRAAVLPFMGVCRHPGHPDRNSNYRVHDVSRNVCPSGINTSTTCEVGTKRGCRHGRTWDALPEVEPHRARSDGTETQAAVRTWERRFTGRSAAATALRRDRCLVNERVPTSLRTTVGLGTLRRIGSILEEGSRGRSRNGTRWAMAKARPHRM